MKLNEENNEQLEDKVIEETEVENVKKEEKVKTKELEDLNDRYKRLFAEFENYKKRTQKESLTKRAEITG